MKRIEQQETSTAQATQRGAEASPAQCQCMSTCARLASSHHIPNTPTNPKTKPQNLTITEITELSAEEQAEIEALLPQSPKTPQKLLQELEERQIEEEPIPDRIQKLLKGTHQIPKRR